MPAGSLDVMISPKSKIRVLSVDDEPRILQALVRMLTVHGVFDVTTATGGAEALQRIRSDGPFAIVTSDLRMPGMDGIEFLGRARELAPDAVRILLTGEHEFTAAVNAVNSGAVFRFVTKPCPAVTLIKTMEAALEQHQLLISERVLLAETLHGCVAALTDLLALVNPEAFARGNRVRQYTAQLCEHLGHASDWQIEIAAMLSQIGCVTLPPETAQRLYHGQPLDDAEKAMVERLPETAVRFLGSIPRLDEVKEIIAGQSRRISGSWTAGSKVPLGSRLIKAAADFDHLLSGNHEAPAALAMMRGCDGMYDPDVLDALAEVWGGSGVERIEELTLAELRPGMVLTSDVRTPTGLLAIGRGQELTEGLLQRIRNFSSRRMSVVEPIYVRVTITPAAPVGLGRPDAVVPA